MTGRLPDTPGVVRERIGDALEQRNYPGGENDPRKRHAEALMNAMRKKAGVRPSSRRDAKFCN